MAVKKSELYVAIGRRPGRALEAVTGDVTPEVAPEVPRLLGALAGEMGRAQTERAPTPSRSDADAVISPSSMRRTSANLSAIAFADSELGVVVGRRGVAGRVFLGPDLRDT